MALVLGRLGADFGQAVVHGEGQGVARLRPVEGDAADAVADFVKEFVAHGRIPIMAKG